MCYRVREGLSYCSVDGSLIFLDFSRGRYFKLSPPAEHVFRSFIEDGKADAAGTLLRLNLIETGPHRQMSWLEHRPATRSIPEQPVEQPPRRLLALLEIIWTVQRTKARLRTKPFGEIINSVTSQQDRVAPPLLADRDQRTAYERAVQEASSYFLYARRYVPAEPSCLLDSVALVIFLARRRLHSQIVFGVTDKPVTAHCWVQAGDWVLNDTVGHTAVHTVVGVV